MGMSEYGQLAIVYCHSWPNCFNCDNANLLGNKQEVHIRVLNFLDIYNSSANLNDTEIYIYAREDFSVKSNGDKTALVLLLACRKYPSIINSMWSARFY